MIKHLSAATAAAALAVAAAAPLSAAAATTLLSEDFSAAAGGTYGGGPIAGTQFQVTTANIDIVGLPSGSPFSCVRVPAGNCLDLVGNGGGGGISSLAGFDLAVGTTYTVSFGAVLQGYGPADPNKTSFLVSLGSFSQSLLADGAGASYSVAFTATGNEADAHLGFLTLVAGDSVHGAVLDHIVLTAVPEPSTTASLAAGLAMLALALRRRAGRAG